MNERIKELLTQAVMAVDNPFPGNPLNNELEKMYIPDCFAEKFAELILKKCMEMFEDAKVNQEDDVDYGLEEAKNIIKEHFGVEE